MRNANRYLNVAGVCSAVFILLGTMGLSASIASEQTGAPDAVMPGSVESGQYIFNAAGCLACHTAKGDGQPKLAGGHEFDTPFGHFYSPNITPDKETGIGSWTLKDFDRALRHGTSPDGEHYYPVFPFNSYTKMTDGDVRDLFAYLRTVEPVKRANVEHDLKWPFGWRWLNWGWKVAFFEPGEIRHVPGANALVTRGAYIAQALAHCSQCHSPRGLGGAVDTARYLSGNPSGPDGGEVPNLTPHPSAAVSDWVEIDLIAYFDTGELPDGDYAGGAMVDVIDNGLSQLTANDRQALARYILSLAPLATPR
jgi:mono/diheme cytochrome c family protein